MRPERLYVPGATTLRRLATPWVVVLALLTALPAAVEAQVASAPARPLRMGYSASVIDSVDLQDAKVALKAWTDITSKEDGTNFVSDANIYSDINDLIKGIKSNELDLVVMTPTEFLEHCEALPLVPTYTGVFGGQTHHPHLLCVHKDSGINTLKQLQGQTLIIENAGVGKLPQIWIDCELARQGLPPSSQFFGKIKTTGKGNQTLLPVFFHQATACIIRENVYNNMVELNPQLGHDIKIIDKSSPLCKSVVSFRTDYDLESRNILIKHALKLHESIKGKQILTLFRTEKIVMFKPEFLDTCRDLWKEYQAIKNKE